MQKFDDELRFTTTRKREGVKLLAFLSQKYVPRHIRENSIPQGDDDSTDYTGTLNGKKKQVLSIRKEGLKEMEK